MPRKSTVLILGAGPRVGSSIASTFASKGYNVAVVSRSTKPSTEGYLSLSADFSKPEQIPGIFAAVKAHFNTPPSVVVYNAAALTLPPDEGSVLSIPVDSVKDDLNVNTVSAYAAAQEAVKGWETMSGEDGDDGVKKTFIYTGNILNTVVYQVPMVLTLGVGKSASAYWIGAADGLYAEKGFRFFFADERLATGKARGQDIDGPAHAEFYAQLAAHEGEVPWHATFVKGKGYVKF